MTKEMMSLKGLIEKAPDADLLREMISFAATRLMELEVGALTGAAHGKKDPNRLAQRNGYRGRGWETRPGPWNCASRSFAKGATSLASLSRAGWRRRR